VAKGAALFGHKCHIDEEIKIRISKKVGVDKENINLDEVADEVKEAAQEEVAETFGYRLKGVRDLFEMPPPGNVTSKSIGLVVINDAGEEVVDNLVIKNDPVPCKGTRRYGTYEEGQTEALFRLMENEQSTGQNESVPISICEEIEKTVMQFDGPMPKGSPIEVIFDLGPDGRLSVDGRDLTTGRQIHIEVNAEGLLTAEELKMARSSALSKTVS
jgi:molecular chaperone DnaK (HSP70)